MHASRAAAAPPRRLHAEEPPVVELPKPDARPETAVEAYRAREGIAQSPNSGKVWQIPIQLIDDDPPYEMTPLPNSF